MRTRRLVLAVLAALAFVTGASAAPPKDAIVIGLVAEPVTMDPPQITDLNSARVTKRIFEGLVGQEPLEDPLGHARGVERSEEHTSELQSLGYLVCRLLLAKKKINHPMLHH